jgi:predicted kinase
VPSPRLVFLYGPPAVGKLTVAREIAEREPFKVLHNHVTVDAVEEVLPFGTPTFWQVVGRLRRDLAAGAAEEGIDLIYTYVFASGEEEHVSDIVAPYQERGGSVFFVQLLAPREVLLQRVLEEDRKRYGKITDPATLESLLDQYDNFTAVVGRESLTIDLGTWSAAEAAEQVIGHLTGRA